MDSLSPRFHSENLRRFVCQMSIQTNRCQGHGHIAHLNYCIYSLDYTYIQVKDYLPRDVLFIVRLAETLEPMSKKNMGSSIDRFLKKENIFEEAQAQAIKGVVAWQLAKAMKRKKISKARMAVLLKTSRTQVDRILDTKRDITLSSLQRAAALVGRRVMIELV
jgi:antitoxin HicB